jgi:hypothetical protein
MSWLVLLAMALGLFAVFVVLFRTFVGYMKKEQNLVIESFHDALIDKDNPVGLNKEELENLKQQQKEAQEHLREVIAKIPVIQKDGRFQIDEEALRQRKAAAMINGANGTSDTPTSDNN